VLFVLQIQHGWWTVGVSRYIVLSVSQSLDYYYNNNNNYYYYYYYYKSNNYYHYYNYY